jgi:hypothetical protein
LESNPIGPAITKSDWLSLKSVEPSPKAYLGTFLNLTSMEDLLSQVTDAKAAITLLALINAVPPDKEN